MFTSEKMRSRDECIKAFFFARTWLEMSRSIFCSRTTTRKIDVAFRMKVLYEPGWLQTLKRIKGLLKITFMEILSLMKFCCRKRIKREIGQSKQTCSIVSIKLEQNLHVLIRFSPLVRWLNPCLELYLPKKYPKCVTSFCSLERFLKGFERSRRGF